MALMHRATGNSEDTEKILKATAEKDCKGLNNQTVRLIKSYSGLRSLWNNYQSVEEITIHCTSRTPHFINESKKPNLAQINKI